MRIKSLLLGASAFVGLFMRNVGVVAPASPWDREPPTYNSGYSYGRRTQESYAGQGPDHGWRGERRAGKRLAFKAVHGRWP